MRWAPIPGWDRYEVSDTGIVRNVETGRFLKPFAVDRVESRPCVTLAMNGTVRKNVRVATLVLEAFVGPRPQGLQCCHNDGDPANSQLSNLRWDTASANQIDSIRHGTHNEVNKTHCPRGHLYDEENTWVRTRRDGRAYRLCRQCRVAQQRERRAVAAASK